jgi:hypothetical protein
MEKLEKMGVPVPEKLKQLKLKLFSSYEIHKKFLSLHDQFLARILGLTSSETPQKPAKKDRAPQTGRSSYRKPPNYEKPLGSKGNSNLEDYLIPVIKLMWSGQDHREAFRQIAKKLDVRYNTVSSQCTRALGLTTDEFTIQVNSRGIISVLERKYPDQYQSIKAELKK